MKNEMVIVAAAVLFSAAGPISADDVYLLRENRFATEELNIESRLNPGEKIIISSAFNLSGKLHVTAEDIDRAVLKYRKVLKASARSRAGAYAEVIEVNFERSSFGMNILLQAPNPAPWAGTDDAGTIEGELRLPEGCVIDVEATYFDMEFKGPFKAIENRSSFGRLATRNVTDRLYLSTVNRDINAEEIKGDISVSTSNADIRIEKIISEHGPARIKNEHGDVLMDEARGIFVIRNSYGKIRLNALTLTGGKSRIVGEHCPIKIEVEDIGGAELSVSSDYEDVRLLLPETVSANFLLTVESFSEMHVEGLSIRPIIIESGHLEFVTGNGGADIEIDIEGAGNIYIQGYPQ